MRTNVLGLLIVIGVVVLGARVGVAVEDAGTPTGEVSERAANEELARRFYEEFHTGDVAVADEIIAADAVFHSTGNSIGREESKQEAAAIKAAFPNVAWSIEDTIVDGDKVAVRWTFSGTHEGEFGGIPASGNRVVVSGISILKIEDGRIVEGWIEFDSFSLLQQLGALPGPATPTS